MVGDDQAPGVKKQAGPTQRLWAAAIPPTANFTGFAPTVWLTANFAPRWFSDAVGESQKPGADARRREILFSVAAVESYLFEWVRDIVLKRDFLRVNEFFPPGSPTAIRSKWKEVPKALASQSLIADAPNLGNVTWADFGRLVEYRNGLLHAAASRPLTSDLPDGSHPVPSPSDLQDVRPGWGVEVIVDLIVELNAAAGTQPPEWIKSIAAQAENRTTR